MAEVDWRLDHDADPLVGRPLRFTKWTSPRDEWDHDHCNFCWAEISADESGHADFNSAWVTADDDYTWVCPDCFTDFHDKFDWRIVE